MVSVCVESTCLSVGPQGMTPACFVSHHLLSHSSMGYTITMVTRIALLTRRNPSPPAAVQSPTCGISTHSGHVLHIQVVCTCCGPWNTRTSTQCIRAVTARHCVSTNLQAFCLTRYKWLREVLVCPPPPFVYSPPMSPPLYPLSPLSCCPPFPHPSTMLTPSYQPVCV